MSSLQSLDIAARSASTATVPVARTHKPEVAKLIDVSSCIGCKACQVACMQWNDLRDDVGDTNGTYDNPRDLTPQSWTVMKYSEVVTRTEDEGDRLEWLIRKDGCMHCDEPGCLKACPAPGAIVKYTNGIVDFISENCIGCGYCVAGCPFDVPRISKVDSKAYKCSLCADRVAVNQEPACVKICPTGAIRFGTKEDMIEYAGDRVVDLKERGYQNAGLYNPAGVGGTHVMYVLQHADKPNLYAGLPENPTISPTVALWKGVAKPLGVAAMIGAAVAGFFHYMKVGPIETHVDEPDVQPTPRPDQRDDTRV
ncbi:formate dehydrogenase subunit beta [Telluria beijingensis]|uniref:formate dehydrogenase subunit beta n=1 Tax=Telluria beijingensis TaxID=3068633 RepID=UPI002795BD76|nr:formate dehydrogenase subunit beta [Massilia sp. REN29]